jgi:hypothetical protein
MSMWKWFSQALSGHIVFFELALAAPFVAFGLYRNLVEGGFDLRFTLAATAQIVGIVGACAVVAWFAVTRPAIRRRSK